MGSGREERIDEPGRVAQGDPAGAAGRADSEAEVRRRAGSEERLLPVEHPRDRRGFVDRGGEELFGAADARARADPIARDDGADARTPVEEGNEPEPAALFALSEDHDLNIALAIAGVAP